jgi:glucose-1-phosphate thymidylyltransferase
MSTSATLSKCVILARGLGTRMRRGDAATRLDTAQSAAAGSGLKAMIPVSRPFLDYVLSTLAEAGFRQACLVIGTEHNAVCEYYTRTHRPQRIQISYAVQAEPLGTADAVLAAKEFAGADEFLTINGDNYYPIEALQIVQCLGQTGTVLFEAQALVRESNIPPERIGEFAYAVLDAGGFLADLVEKPDAETAAILADPKLVSMNCWRFGPRIFPICREVPISPRGEYELPMVVKLGIQRGMKFKAATCRAGVLDLSRRSDIAAVAEHLRNVKVQL